MISSSTSIALNRVAIGQAASGKSDLGGIVLANGRFAIGERLKPLLEAGRAAHLLTFDDAEDGVSHLLWPCRARRADSTCCSVTRSPSDRAEIGRDAARATDQFLTLFGSANTGPKIHVL